MSDSMRPHRRQPIRLPHPWYSPGKNTGVGCHFLLQCMKVKSESEVAQSCPTLHDPWTAASQAPLSMRFPRQEYWSGVPLPSPRERLVHTFTYRSKSIHRIDVRATHQGHVVRPVIYSFRVICTMTKSMVELKKWKICNIPWSNFSLSMLWLPHLRK